jgi:hypothetical protein
MWVTVTTAWRTGPPEMAVLDILNQQSRTPDNGWSSRLGVGREANKSPPYKNILVTKRYTRLWTSRDSLERPRQRKMDSRFGARNVISFYTVGSKKTVASKLAKYKLDIVAVSRVRWDNAGSKPADNYTFVYGSGGGGGWERFTKFLSKTWRERPFEDLGIDARIILHIILGKYCVKVWTGCIWLRIRTSGGLLWTW